MQIDRFIKCHYSGLIYFLPCIDISRLKSKYYSIFYFQFMFLTFECGIEIIFGDIKQ